MFSLVTALVSPCVIDVLRYKKDTLVNTLQENANVLCSQPTESVCMLQGEWENIKKAYAILEEFYFRAQAEVMVRQMLKVEGEVSPEFGGVLPRSRIGGTSCVGSSALGRIPDQVLSSLFSTTADQLTPTSNRHWSPFRVMSNAQKQSCKSGSDEHNTKKHRAYVYPQSAMTKQSSEAAEAEKESGKDEECGGATTCAENGKSTEATVEANSRVRMENDDSPPVLLRENIDGTDVVSLSSETSDPKDLDLYGAMQPQAMMPSCVDVRGGTEVVANAISPMFSTTSNEEIAFPLEKLKSVGADVNSLSDGVSGQIVNASEKTFLSISEEDDPAAENDDDGAPAGSGGSCAISQRDAISSSASSSAINLSHHIVNAAAFHTQQYLNETIAAGHRLPQFSSLFIGGSGSASNHLPATSSSNVPSSWHYADLYSMHLSAMQSMRIKQEPASSSVAERTSLSAQRAVDDSLGRDGTGSDQGYRYDDDAHLPELRCTRCEKTYRSEARMKEHVRTHDDGYVPVLHSCPKCGKSFTYRHNMVVHLRRFHYGWQPAKRHACRLCGVKFQKPYLLRLHEHKAHVQPMPPGVYD